MSYYHENKKLIVALLGQTFEKKIVTSINESFITFLLKIIGRNYIIVMKEAKLRDINKTFKIEKSMLQNRLSYYSQVHVKDKSSV